MEQRVLSHECQNLVLDSKASVEKSVIYICDNLLFRQANTSGYHTMLVVLFVLETYKRCVSEKKKRDTYIYI